MSILTLCKVVGFLFRGRLSARMNYVAVHRMPTSHEMLVSIQTPTSSNATQTENQRPYRAVHRLPLQLILSKQRSQYTAEYSLWLSFKAAFGPAGV